MALTMINFIVCFSQQRYVSSSHQSESDNHCHYMKLMNHYLAITYPDIIPPKYLLVDTINSGEQFIIGNNDIFYRFLSTVSGLPTPYNRIPGNIRIEGNDWVYCNDHIHLINWYANNMDRISCEEIYEYYNLINYEVPCPNDGEDLLDYVDRIGLYHDSIHTRLKIFESRYNLNKREDDLLFPLNTFYDKDQLSRIKALINPTSKITIIMKTR